MHRKTHYRRVIDQSSKLVRGLDLIGSALFSEADPRGLEPHEHEGAYELCFLERGSVEWCIFDTTYKIPPGHIFLTKPNELHGGLDGTMHPCKLNWLLFRLDPDLGSFGFPAELTAELSNRLDMISERVVPAPGSTHNQFERLFNAATGKSVFRTAEINAHMQLILIDIMSALEKNSKQEQALKHSSPISKVLDAVRDDVGSILSADQMATMAGLKSSRFRELFKAETGHSPIEFLNLHRVEEAKRLLVESQESITEIAHAAGFQSSQYFAKCFKKLTGTSPLRYRRHHQI